MPRPTLYVAITNHGFGHATRTAALLAEIQHQCPDILLILVTSAPRWLLESYLPGDFIYRPHTLDVGVIQPDSLTLNREATRQKLQEIRDREAQIIAAEVDFIRLNRVQLVLADIPPLAAKIAQAAGVPCWMVSNFGWDLIYRQWGEAFADIVNWVQDCFQSCDRLFRLPLHEPMEIFAQITDVGLTGASPRFTPEQIRSSFSLHVDPAQTVLLTFGGLGLAKLPYDQLAQFSGWQFITFDPKAPEVLPNLLKVQDRAYRPVDFMPLCGRVVSKPGYGTFAEALRQQTPIVTLPRDGFAEAQYLLDGLKKYSTHQILPPDAFTTAPWQFLHQPLQPPQSEQPLGTDGNQTIAAAVIAALT
ncbi:glycosyl transferase [Synechococcales cyanobacterium C]|uniref:Glycosyl transferase n=2 Tax=Petrachloros TaxID=2918834 RepID=A0A8K2A0X2_9CYAN|nr:glycosyl transferase [Petrachloros mirabilis]NCJ07752.1 glycosyl transferase [Petrachloros mirabilis ULC683]